MARRYVRDNRGRFASVGATARGGRLRTASGNKRATVKGKIQGAVPGGTIRPNRRSKPKEVEAPTGKRQIVRGNFRPQNTMAKPTRRENPFGNKDQTKPTNIKVAQDYLASKGYKNVGTYAEGKRKGGSQSQARTIESTPLRDRFGNVSFNEPSVRSIELNRSSPAWKNPGQAMRERRRAGWISSSSPTHALNHEIGHMRDAGMNKRGGGLDPWKVREGGDRRQAIARRVSRYAATQPDEFVAEVFAGLRAGNKYDSQVMSQYRALRGRRARSIRSQLKRK